jgi:L-asparagine transporter-like permease
MEIMIAGLLGPSTSGRLHGPLSTAARAFAPVGWRRMLGDPAFLPHRLVGHELVQLAAAEAEAVSGE